MSRKDPFCTRAHGARTQFEKFSLVRLFPTVSNPQLAPSRGLIAVEILNQVSHVLRSFGADCICCKDWLYTHCIAEIHHLEGALRQHADTRARTARI